MGHYDSKTKTVEQICDRCGYDFSYTAKIGYPANRAYCNRCQDELRAEATVELDVDLDPRPQISQVVAEVEATVDGKLPIDVEIRTEERDLESTEYKEPRTLGVAGWLGISGPAYTVELEHPLVVKDGFPHDGMTLRPGSKTTWDVVWDATDVFVDHGYNYPRWKVEDELTTVSGAPFDVDHLSATAVLDVTRDDEPLWIEAETSVELPQYLVEL
jgi:hypothetical protein